MTIQPGAHDLVSLEREFDTFAGRAQLAIPPDMRKQLLADFAELHRMLNTLRDYLRPEDQPDDTFLIDTVMRSL